MASNTLWIRIGESFADFTAFKRYVRHFYNKSYDFYSWDCKRSELHSIVESTFINWGHRYRGYIGQMVDSLIRCPRCGGNHIVYSSDEICGNPLRYEEVEDRLDAIYVKYGFKGSKIECERYEKDHPIEISGYALEYFDSLEPYLDEIPSNVSKLNTPKPSLD